MHARTHGSHACPTAACPSSLPVCLALPLLCDMLRLLVLVGWQEGDQAGGAGHFALGMLGASLGG